MKRHPLWEERLAAMLADWEGRARFDPGTTDCCLFAADDVLAVWGFDPAAPFRGQYQTITAGRRLLGKPVGRWLSDTLTPVTGWPPRGAVIMDRSTRAQGMPALGVMDMNSVYFLGPKGLARTPWVPAMTGFVPRQGVV